MEEHPVAKKARVDDSEHVEDTATDPQPDEELVTSAKMASKSFLVASKKCVAEIEDARKELEMEQSVEPKSYTTTDVLKIGTKHGVRWLFSSDTCTLKVAKLAFYTQDNGDQKPYLPKESGIVLAPQEWAALLAAAPDVEQAFISGFAMENKRREAVVRYQQRMQQKKMTSFKKWK